MGEEEEEEQLEEVSKRLISREEQLFSQESVSEQEEDQLQRDYEALRLQLWMAVNNTFTSSTTSSASSSSTSTTTTPAHLRVLRSAMLSIQQQEAQDQTWRGRGQEGRVPEWRPQRCLNTHNALLQKMVESRLAKAVAEEQAGAGVLSSPLKREVSWCRSSSWTHQRRSLHRVSASCICAGVLPGEACEGGPADSVQDGEGLLPSLHGHPQPLRCSVPPRLLHTPDPGGGVWPRQRRLQLPALLG